MKEEIYEGKFGKNGEVKIKMTMGKDQQLQLHVIDEKNGHHYYQLINQEYMNDQLCFINIFQKPVELYEQLKRNISKCQLDASKLQFEYRFTDRNKAKMMSIELLKMEKSINKQKLELDLKIQKLEQSFALELLQFKKSLEAEKGRRLELKEELQKLSSNVAQIMMNHQQHIEAMHKEIEVLKSRNVPVQQAIPAPQNSQAAQPSQPKLGGGRNLKPIETPISTLGNHPQNAHRQFYKVIVIKNGCIKIIRQNKDGRYNFVNNFKICPQFKVKYSIQMQSVKNNSLMVGFCTERGLGNYENFYHPQSAYYSTYGGGIFFQAGIQRGLNVACGDDDLIECQIDRPNKKMIWWKNNAKIIESDTPPQFKDKDVYFSMILNYSNDDVDLFL